MYIGRIILALVQDKSVAESVILVILVINKLLGGIVSKIIVLEDNEPLAKGIVYALEKEGWRVDLSYTVREFSDMFFASAGIRGGTYPVDMAGEEKEVRHYDLVLLDVLLPDGNGFDLCRKIRTVSDVPIIFLTACDAEVNIVLGLDMGADDYITKPFRTRELISRINAALRRSNKKADNNKVLISKDFAFDLANMKLFKKNREILLTPTEYKLVSIFMQNSEMLLDRKTILLKLWDINGEFIDDNTLSVYVSRLREKLEEIPEMPEYICTVRGLGYKWCQRSRWL